MFAHKHKCNKGESKLTWNTSGQNGKSGANGVNGANGAPGQPQSIKVFSATVPREGPAVTLFSADGITYTFECAPFFGLNIGLLQAAGAAGQSYGSAVFRRPVGQEQEATDLSVFVQSESLGGAAKTIATTANTLENKAKQFEQLGVWTVWSKARRATPRPGARPAGSPARPRSSRSPPRPRGSPASSARSSPPATTASTGRCRPSRSPSRSRTWSAPSSPTRRCSPPSSRSSPSSSSKKNYREAFRLASTLLLLVTLVLGAITALFVLARAGDHAALRARLRRARSSTSPSPSPRSSSRS